MASNSQLLTVQILTNNVQVLILRLSYFINTVLGAKYKYLCCLISYLVFTSRMNSKFYYYQELSMSHDIFDNRCGELGAEGSQSGEIW